MVARKNPKYDMNLHRGVFFNIGLVISLLMVIAAFEWRFYDDTNLMNIGPSETNFEEIFDVPITEQPPPPAPQVIKNVQIISVEDIEDIEDEIEINLDIEMTDDMKIEEIRQIDMGEIEEEDNEQIFIIVEDKPEPIGGMAAFYKFVNDNIKYPRSAQTMNIEGRVFIQFVVGKKGEITDITVLRGIGSGCDEEAVRVLENAPNWQPGKQRGRPVKVKMVLPIIFKLDR